MPGVLLTVSSGTGVEKRSFALTVRKLPIPTGPGPNRLAAEGLATDSRPGTECCYAAGQGLVQDSDGLSWEYCTALEHIETS
jgi:hypothetical protein